MPMKGGRTLQSFELVHHAKCDVTLHCQSVTCTWVFKQNIRKPTAGRCPRKLLFSNSSLRKPLSQLTGNDTVHQALIIITFSEVQNRNISLFLFLPLASKDSSWKVDLPRNSLCSLLKQTSNMCVRIKNAILQSHYGEKRAEKIDKLSSQRMLSFFWS